MNIYIGNLNYTVKEEQLQQIFSEYGAVETVKIIKDRNTGKAKGYAFVTMSDDGEAREAIEKLDQKEIFGRKVKVVEARDESEQPRRQNNGGFKRNFNRN